MTQNNLQANYKLTLNDIRSESPCVEGWETLLRSLGKTTADDTEIKIGYIAKSNSIDDALWVLFNCVKGCQKEKAYLMHDIAARVLHIYESKYPDDKRISACLVAIKDFADGKITQEQLRAAAEAATRAAGAATRAAGAAAWAARAAAEAAAKAAMAAWSAEAAAARAAGAAEAATRAAAEEAAWAAAWAAAEAATRAAGAAGAAEAAARAAAEEAAWAAAWAAAGAAGAAEAAAWAAAARATEELYQIDLIIKYFGE